MSRVALPGVDRELSFTALLGLFVGSIIGAMAQVVPYAMILLTALGLSLLAWRQEGGFTLILLVMGLLLGSAFGNMANVIPYGITLYLAILLAVMVWRTQGGTLSSGATTTIAMILFLIVAEGILWSGTHTDFCQPFTAITVGGVTTTFNDVCLNPGVSGYITAWQGCVSTCAITPINFLGNSPLAYLLQGDFVGFITSFTGGTTQSSFPGGPSTGCSILSSFVICASSPAFWTTIASILTGAIGLILLFLGSGVGIGGQAQVAATGIGGSIRPNVQGTRLYQALGTGWIIWSFVTSLAFSGGWFQYLGFGLGGSGSLAGGLFYIMFFSIYTYMLYEQARTYF